MQRCFFINYKWLVQEYTFSNLVIVQLKQAVVKTLKEESNNIEEVVQMGKDIEN